MEVPSETTSWLTALVGWAIFAWILGSVFHQPGEPAWKTVLLVALALGGLVLLVLLVIVVF